MVWIPGSNNGTFGVGMSRGAVFPADPGYFYQGFPLPNIIQHPTGVVDKPYIGRAFGSRAFGSRAFGKRGRRFGMVYELTPGGVTTEAGWGFKNRAFGRRSKRRSKRRSRRRSRRNRRSRRSRRNRRSKRRS